MSGRHCNRGCQGDRAIGGVRETGQQGVSGRQDNRGCQGDRTTRGDRTIGGVRETWRAGEGRGQWGNTQQLWETGIIKHVP